MGLEGGVWGTERTGVVLYVNVCSLPFTLQKLNDNYVCAAIESPFHFNGSNSDSIHQIPIMKHSFNSLDLSEGLPVVN